jgi:hypothetical protein
VHLVTRNLYSCYQSQSSKRYLRSIQ